jgi:hypothetical protein
MSIFMILFLVLLVAWLLGLGVFHVAGVFIHILPHPRGNFADYALCARQDYLSVAGKCLREVDKEMTHSIRARSLGEQS